MPEQVSLNIAINAPVPKASLPGHAWDSIEHDNTVTWMCNWTENVQRQSKYVMLAASSTFKGQNYDSLICIVYIAVYA